MKHDLQPSDKAHIIQTISEHLLTNHEEVLAAYCFGSFLTGAFADIDLGLLLHMAPDDALAYEMSLENEMEKLIPCPIDIRVINGAPISFCQAVVRGKALMATQNTPPVAT